MALTINAYASAQGTGNPSGGTVTVTLPGTPQAGDRYVIAAVCSAISGSPIIGWTSGSGSGWTTHRSLGVNQRARVLASRAWQSGDATTQTLEVTFPVSGTHKWLFVSAWLIRPGSGNTVTYRTYGDGAAVSGSTDSVTLGASPVSGDAIVVGHMNDDKGTVYSNEVHGAFSLTAHPDLTAGSGAPTNWSSAGFSSGITTSTSTTVSVDHDDTGANYTMIAGAFYEFTGNATATPAAITVAATLPQAAPLDVEWNAAIISDFDYRFGPYWTGSKWLLVLRHDTDRFMIFEASAPTWNTEGTGWTPKVITGRPGVPGGASAHFANGKLHLAAEINDTLFYWQWNPSTDVWDQEQVTVTLGTLNTVKTNRVFVHYTDEILLAATVNSGSDDFISVWGSSTGAQGTWSTAAQPQVTDPGNDVLLVGFTTNELTGTSERHQLVWFNDSQASQLSIGSYNSSAGQVGSTRTWSTSSWASSEPYVAQPGKLWGSTRRGAWYVSNGTTGYAIEAPEDGGTTTGPTGTHPVSIASIQAIIEDSTNGTNRRWLLYRDNATSDLYVRQWESGLNANWPAARTVQDWASPNALLQPVSGTYRDGFLNYLTRAHSTNTEWWAGRWGVPAMPAAVSVAVTLPQATASEEAGGDVTRTPTAITVAVSLPQAVRSGGAQRTPTAVTVAVTLPQAIGAGFATVTFDPITVAVTLPQAATQVGALRTPAFVTVAVAVPQAVRQGGASRSPSAVAVAVTLPQAAAFASTIQTVDPVAVTATLPQAVRSGGAARTPTAVTVAATLPQAVRQGGAARTLTPVTVAVTLPQTAATGTSGRTPAAVIVAVTLPQATRAGGALRTLAVLPVAVTVPQTARFASELATPATVTVAVSLPQTQASSTELAEPATVTVAVTLPQAARSAGALRTVQPVTVAVSLPQATPQVGADVTVTPTPVTVAVTLPQTTRAAGATRTVTATTVAVTVGLVTVTATETASPDPVTVTASLPQSAASGGASRVPAVTLVAVTLPQAVAGVGTVTQPATVTVAVTLPQAAASSTELAEPDSTTVAVTLPQTVRTAGATRSPATVGVAVSLPPVAVTATEQTTPDPVTVAVSLPQTSRTGGAARTPTSVAVAVAVPQANPVIAGSATVTPTSVTVAATLNQTVRTAGATRTVAAVPVAVTVPQASPVEGFTVTPTTITMPLTVPAAIRLGGALRTIVTVVVDLTPQTATVAGGASVTVTPDGVTVTITLPQPANVGVLRRRTEGRGKAGDRLEALASAAQRTEGRER